MRWRRSEPPGEDVCSLVRRRSGWLLRGNATFGSGQRRADLEYAVTCDAGFATQRAEVRGIVGTRPISCVLIVDGPRWSLNGKPVPSVDGCVDVDLSFTPATNLLPIRRLRLRVGQSRSIPAVWLRFPRFDVRRLDQTYRRIDATHYRYRSGAFRATLTVNRRGFVVRYGRWWTQA